MANPSVSSISIDGMRFNALSIHFGVSAPHSVGMPMMGALVYSIDVSVDMHDVQNMPYETLQKLYKLASNITKDSIKPMKVEFWVDDSQTDALCTYSFDGWISHFANSSGVGGNHTLTLSLQPKLDEKQFVSMSMGN